MNWQHDPHGNWVARCTFPEKTREFSVTVDLQAELAPFNPFDFFIEPYAATYPFVLPDELVHELGAYLDPRRSARGCARFIADVPRGPVGTVQFLVDLNNRVQRAVTLHGAHGRPARERRRKRWRPAAAPAATALAAGAGAAPSRAAGAFRVGLPDPAQAGRGAADGRAPER